MTKEKTKTCDCAHCYFSCRNTGRPFITLHSYILAQEKQNKSPFNNNHARPPIFSPTNFLGSGSFGSVYKGEFDGQDGECKDLVAVKVLKLQTPGALRSFMAECEALRNMRHRNLVKIVTACASIDARGNDFKAIVYDFMPNRSLDGWLHPEANDQTEQRFLDLAERVSILLDVAYTLDYLHCDGPTPIIHCDLKPSNVLLDADMVAHVGDFGLAKIIIDGSSTVQQSTSSMGVRGTIGYAAPG